MSHKYPVRPEQAEELVDTLYQGSSTEEPGEALDNLILGQAKAVHDGTDTASSKGFTQRIFKWQRYASIAATLVIVVTIGMIYTDNKSELRPESAIVLPPAPLVEESQGFKAVAEETSEYVLEEEVAEVDGFVEADASETTYGAGDSDRAVLSDTVSPGVKELAKPIPRKLERKKSLEVRSLMAPPPMLKQKAIAKESVKAEKSSVEVPSKLQIIEGIREAIAADDMGKAKTLWELYLKHFQSEQAPADLLRFFREDFEIRQSE